MKQTKQTKQKKPLNQPAQLSTLGLALQKRRQDLSLEIQQLAALSNTSKVFVSKLERGILHSAQIAKVEAVCKVLNYRLILSVQDH